MYIYPLVIHDISLCDMDRDMGICGIHKGFLKINTTEEIVYTIDNSDQVHQPLSEDSDGKLPSIHPR